MGLISVSQGPSSASEKPDFRKDSISDMHWVDSFEEVKEVINHHRADLELKYQISKIVVFESAARNRLTESSDIEILIEFNRSVGFFTLTHLQSELRSLLGRDVDLTTPGALHPLLKESILQDLVYVRIPGNRNDGEVFLSNELFHRSFRWRL
ncbi:nucleotidyltransferase family protein [uncultured Methanospirillum sp.]|uniref:nucleotidyltransferase family protein n=1 Tax=uncultured Methanospirillum sp. TaxID=262503 RepID=UPI00374A3135